MLKKVLVANRGEIALRVVRTCRERGIRTVAVFSEADRSALHVRFADEAVEIGPAPPRESYLRIDRILEAAKRTGADSVHPGYGFLAQNAEFAEACEGAGLVFVGPPPSAMRAMGDKVSSRRTMVAAGVPIVPGTVDPVATPEEAARVAEGIGYPVALKAVGGGGGKGIRRVARAAEIASSFRTASGEAAAAFGDGRLYVEKYLEAPRHVEVQVLADAQGACVSLGERECTIQRRHQKLIEETPSPAIDEGTRRAIEEAAVRAAKAVGYRNAGTVEFLFQDGAFHFLEMNTRLQVEHPVTEMATGLDIVAEQLRIAAGEPLGYESVARRGHAIEVRVNAEDPEAGFAPSAGVVRNLRLPAGPFVRTDSALYRGLEVTLHYDPILAKVIAWAPTRAEAIARMERALQELHVGGVRTGGPFALRVLRDPAFRRGEFDTHFLERFAPPADPSREEVVALLAAAVAKGARERLGAADGSEREALSPWTLLGRWQRMRGRPR
ncbi:MAG TPA: acetyl-CoA carboxylase biotin carboxylase subunit [Planctomycetota bacterium]|jgi:acetyl-CoA carboxylase biotin carboxylase subunit|nr:acetyl-CoA carboxylase biotin carboxylase subunit [Planctomycetota bacterium]